VEDIGVVIYSKGEEPGTLTAKWHHKCSGSGTGKATGGPVGGFPGTYKIIYFDLNGRQLSGFDLKIEQQGDHFDLTWLSNGLVRFRGIGMLALEGLAAGWQSATE
jgi:hypothetical protein